MNDIEARVLRIIAEQLGQSSTHPAPTDRLVDLGADSLDCAEILMAMEEEFEIEIADEEGEKVLTVQQAIELVRGKVSGAAI